ncbi:MAG: DUF1553 domain-containing protein [Acidobacteria bacterium]|nr:DUF1553 domain-containing protein [Acidobacteriota bacterium]
MRLSRLLPCLAAAPAVWAQNIEFNRDVRPVLSDRCFTCHGPDPGNRKTALRFDTEAGAAPSIVPGDPERSKLYQRIASTNRALRMPPASMGHDALKPGEIRIIRDWIQQGARWQAHWSLIPPKRPDARNIDELIHARLTRSGLEPSPEAPRHVLIRRLSLDLTGLPPTPAEVDAFVSDRAPEAYERVVDRLLASPRHAERMAIRWLEAARYADTNGYQSDGVRTMWPWRDWVIRAFQNNLPFDRFTIEQLAGDLLPGATLDQRIATAFHRNHRTSAEGGIVDEEFRVEYVADRAETTATVWLGLTMGCARCHDHKYDPVTQRDFYRMFAFFNNVPEKGFVYNFGNEPPFIAAPDAHQAAKLKELDDNAGAAGSAWDSRQQAVRKAQAKWEKGLRPGPSVDWRPQEGLLLREELEDPSFDGKRSISFGDEKAKFNHRDPLTLTVRVNARSPKGAILTRAEDYWEGTGYGIYLVEGKIRFHFVYRWTDLGMRVETRDPLPLNAWHDVTVTYDGSMLAAGTRIYVDGKEWPLKVLFDQHVWPINQKAPLRIGAGGGLGFDGQVSEAGIYNRALSPDEVRALTVRRTLNEIARTSPASRSAADTAKLRLAFVDAHLPADLAGLRRQARDAQAARDKFHASLPTVMVMEERRDPRPSYILKRGAYDAPGEPVQAGVPSALPQLPSDARADRLALARWVVSRENPLTARVAVNRYWQMLFGAGLVRTVEDFGSQGDWPVHQDVLDWLATEFMDSGWNVRHILKTIVMSRTYRQSSKVAPELLQRDPENRLLARAPRLRLPAEMIRDQALAVSGLLVGTVGGPPVRPYQPPGLWQELTGGGGYKADDGEGLYRRSLYTYWRRTIAPPSMITFDSPTRENCIVRETRTNTPLQALNLMNDVTYVEAARKLAERILRAGGDPGQGFRFVLGRDPSPAERDAFATALSAFRGRYQTDAKGAEALISQGASKPDPRWNASELAAYTAAASLLLNLDETVTKE